MPSAIAELPERASTYNGSDMRVAYSPVPQKSGVELSSTMGSTGPSSPPSLHGSPPVAPAPLFASPPYEEVQGQIHGHQHPAHAPSRTDYYPPPQSYSYPHQSHHSHYALAPHNHSSSMSNAPADLYADTGNRPYAAHEAARDQKPPSAFSHSPDVIPSPHSHISSESMGSGASQRYGIAELRAPRARHGKQGSTQQQEHFQDVADRRPELGGRPFGYELPTIRSPDRPREMGVSSRTQLRHPPAPGHESLRDAARYGESHHSRDEEEDFKGHAGHRGP